MINPVLSLTTKLFIMQNFNFFCNFEHKYMFQNCVKKHDKHLFTCARIARHCDRSYPTKPRSLLLVIHPNNVIKSKLILTNVVPVTACCRDDICLSLQGLRRRETSGVWHLLCWSTNSGLNRSVSISHASPSAHFNIMYNSGHLKH